LPATLLHEHAVCEANAISADSTRPSFFAITAPRATPMLPGLLSACSPDPDAHKPFAARNEVVKGGAENAGVQHVQRGVRVPRADVFSQLVNMRDQFSAARATPLLKARRYSAPYCFSARAIWRCDTPFTKSEEQLFALMRQRCEQRRGTKKKAGTAFMSVQSVCVPKSVAARA